MSLEKKGAYRENSVKKERFPNGENGNLY